MNKIKFLLRVRTWIGKGVVGWLPAQCHVNKAFQGKDVAPDT